MITLITGTPGAGKTLYCVSMLLAGEYAGRPLFVDGIPELVIDHEPAQEIDSWHEWIPKGEDAVLVVDECQRVFRPRHHGKNVPPAVEAMETHRHLGVDIVLMTQHPNLLDSNVRRLVGRHIHVRRLWGMGRTMIYEWDGATDPQRTSTAVSKPWKYPKKAFSMYKSATAHTARKQAVPASLWLLILAIVLVPIVGYAGYNTLFSRFDNPVADVEPVEAGGMLGLPSAALPQRTNLSDDSEHWQAQDFLPRDARYPESAPAYDHLTEVKVFPKISACIDFGEKGCQCITQQGSRVYQPQSACLDRVDNWPFDPYKEDALDNRYNEPVATGISQQDQGVQVQNDPNSPVIAGNSSSNNEPFTRANF